MTSRNPCATRSVLACGTEAVTVRLRLPITRLLVLRQSRSVCPEEPMDGVVCSLSLSLSFYRLSCVHPHTRFIPSPLPLFSHHFSHALFSTLTALSRSHSHPHSPTHLRTHACALQDVVNKLVITSSITPEEAASIKLLNNTTALERTDKLLPLFQGPDELTLTMATTLENPVAARVFGECTIA